MTKEQAEFVAAAKAADAAGQAFAQTMRPEDPDKKAVDAYAAASAAIAKQFGP